MTTLYHGTEKVDQIIENGFNTELVFLTPSLEMALEYGADVVEVEVLDSDLLIDLDQSASGVSVETANIYYGEDRSISDYISIGHSVCCASQCIKSVTNAF